MFRYLIDTKINGQYIDASGAGKTQHKQLVYANWFVQKTNVFCYSLFLIETTWNGTASSQTCWLFSWLVGSFLYIK